MDYTVARIRPSIQIRHGDYLRHQFIALLFINIKGCLQNDPEIQKPTDPTVELKSLPSILELAEKYAVMKSPAPIDMILYCICSDSQPNGALLILLMQHVISKVIDHSALLSSFSVQH